MASGDSLHVFKPGAAEPPPSNHAPFTAIVTDTGQRPTLLYDDGTAETGIWSSSLNRAYDGGGLTVSVRGSMAGANTGTKKVRIEVAIERVIDGDNLGTGGSDFAAAQSVSITVNNTAELYFTGTVTFTSGAQMDSLLKGDSFRAKVARAPGHADDDAVGDYQLNLVEIKET